MLLRPNSEFEYEKWIWIFHTEAQREGHLIRLLIQTVQHRTEWTDLDIICSGVKWKRFTSTFHTRDDAWQSHCCSRVIGWEPHTRKNAHDGSMETKDLYVCLFFLSRCSMLNYKNMQILTSYFFHHWQPRDPNIPLEHAAPMSACAEIHLLWVSPLPRSDRGGGGELGEAGGKEWRQATGWLVPCGELLGNPSTRSSLHPTGAEHASRLPLFHNGRVTAQAKENKNGKRTSSQLGFFFPPNPLPPSLLTVVVTPRARTLTRLGAQSHNLNTVRFSSLFLACVYKIRSSQSLSSKKPPTRSQVKPIWSYACPPPRLVEQTPQSHL